MKKQSGSAHVVVVIILVVALLGSLGFIFWQNFIDKDSDTKSDEKQTVKQEDIKKDVVSGETKDPQSVPDGYAAYNDEAAGFSFAYPKEWGSLKDMKIEQRAEFGIGTFGLKTSSVSDSKGIERITVYRKDSFYTKTAGGYIVRYQGDSVVGSDTGSNDRELKSPIAGTNVYSNIYGDAGSIAYDLFFEAGGSIVNIYVGDSKDIQSQIAKSVKVE